LPPPPDQPVDPESSLPPPPDQPVDLEGLELSVTHNVSLGIIPSADLIATPSASPSTTSLRSSETKFPSSQPTLRTGTIEGSEEGGQSSPWNVGVAYRIPDTNFNLQGSYQQGRANVQLSCAPDEYAPFLGPNGFTNGVGPGNLGLSLNLSV
jgi:hypothetical protein